MSAVAKKAHLWNRDKHDPRVSVNSFVEMEPWKRALEVGAAGEHLVCADLLLSGYRAFLASQGAPYDVIVDLAGKLVRIAVKSTRGPRPRPGRPGSRGCYSFAIGRRKRDHLGKTSARAYEPTDVDIVAVVALDIKQVGYLPIAGCPTMLCVHAATGAERTTRFGPVSLRGNRSFNDLSFNSALEGRHALT